MDATNGPSCFLQIARIWRQAFTSKSPGSPISLDVKTNSRILNCSMSFFSRSLVRCFLSNVMRIQFFLPTFFSKVWSSVDPLKNSFCRLYRIPARSSFSTSSG